MPNWVSQEEFEREFQVFRNEAEGINPLIQNLCAWFTGSSFIDGAPADDHINAYVKFEVNNEEYSANIGMPSSEMFREASDIFAYPRQLFSELYETVPSTYRLNDNSNRDYEENNEVQNY